MKQLFYTAVACLLLASLAACPGRAQNNNPTTNEMNGEKIVLPAPAESGATLLDALRARSSVRSYAPDGLSLEQLSGVMWAAAGENRPGVDGAPGRLTAPSASARYPIRTYAVLAQGIYLYDAPSHSLTLVARGDHRRVTGMQDFVYTAPLNIVYVADLAAYDGNYGSMSEADQLRICGMDAMGQCQNANLWAAANGMGAVTRLMAPGPEFLRAIDAPGTYRFVLAQTVGVPAVKEPAIGATAK
ncbi:MAG: SagB/ThcOx family dehydrogenase [Alistipes sp.]|jgi:nitroreductase|nr:SagB/ThcOx family dehydrogenase [Alistipes sp.]